jgi:hypothetical protein
MNKTKWFDFLFETQDDSYQQRLYKVPVRLKVRKLIGGNKSETEDDIRAVSDVTSLSLPRDRKSDSENWYMTYDIKFDLPDNMQGKEAEFVRQNLIPGITEIPGVEILSYGESFQVYDAQDDSVGDPSKDRSKVFGGDKRRLTKKDDNIPGE